MKKTIKDFLLRKIFLKKGVKVLKNKKGFSLIEIMVGLGLLVIIGGIATTQYANYTERAKNGAVNATLSSIERAIGVCVADGTVAISECMKVHVNNTIIGKKGIGIAIKTATPNTCFYVMEDKNAIGYKKADGTDYTLTALTEHAIFGRSAFVTATGSKVTPSIDEAAQKAVDGKLATKCGAANDH